MEMPASLIRRFNRATYAVDKISCLLRSESWLCSLPFRHRTPFGFQYTRSLSMNLDDTFDEELEHAMMYDDETKFLKSFFRIPGTSQRLFLVQPKPSVFSKAHRDVHPLSDPELQLEENIALVQSLPGWHVVDHKLVNAISLKKGSLFGSGNFEMLVEAIQHHRNISGVFIGVELLNGEQLAEFTHAFSGLPVYDRYRIVLEIFQQHAKSSEAKLQIELAKIPMIRSLMQSKKRNYETYFGKELMLSVGTHDMNVDRVKNAIRDREAKLRKALVRLQLTRQARRKYRTEANVPSIAVVGYTNAGKTSLIRSLSRDERLMPRDYLFATLDVTCHPVQLPTGIKAVYLDTIGFISDMPTVLLESFSAVLEEVMQGTVIVHVRDVSHPDRKYQKDTVLRQLKALKLPTEKLANIIEVCNKTDKLSSDVEIKTDDDIAPDAIMLSLVDGSGLEELKARIEESVTRQAGFRRAKFILPAADNDELMWLYQNAFVQQVSEHPNDTSKLSVDVLLDLTTMKRYQAQFGKTLRKRARTEASSADAA